MMPLSQVVLLAGLVALPGSAENPTVPQVIPSELPALPGLEIPPPLPTVAPAAVPAAGTSGKPFAIRFPRRMNHASLA